MNREIKFRGISPYDKNFRNGNLVIHGIIAYILSKGQGQIECENEVLLDTIGQFTGLHDKDGKEIYEGDIVRLDNGDDEPEIRPCEWNNKRAGFWYPKEYEDGLFDWIYLGTTLEVIGNIHQSPELLKP